MRALPYRHQQSVTIIKRISVIVLAVILEVVCNCGTQPNNAKFLLIMPSKFSRSMKCCLFEPPGKAKEKYQKPIILSVTQTFATMMHPFRVDKEWCRGMSNKDTKKIDG